MNYEQQKALAAYKEKFLRAETANSDVNYCRMENYRLAYAFSDLKESDPRIKHAEFAAARSGNCYHVRDHLSDQETTDEKKQKHLEYERERKEYEDRQTAEWQVLFDPVKASYDVYMEEFTRLQKLRDDCAKDAELAKNDARAAGVSDDTLALVTIDVEEATAINAEQRRMDLIDVYLSVEEKEAKFQAFLAREKRRYDDARRRITGNRRNQSFAPSQPVAPRQPACRYGNKCYDASCRYAHPAGHSFKVAQEAAKFRKEQAAKKAAREMAANSK